MLNTRLAAVLLTAALAASAHAAPLQAAAVAAPYSQIDPNIFILGHPASPHWKVVHAGGEHPAVMLARRAGHAVAIDPNLFPVQPPASVRWLTSREQATDSIPTMAAVTR
jgi:hypothetical protein